MNMQSRKQEALSLLALDELDVMQTGQLDWLTICQADSNFKAGSIPRYTISVDACLRLPKPKDLFWNLEEAIGDYPFVTYLVDNEKFEPQSHGDDKRSLSLAMLKCWWAIQED